MAKRLFVKDLLKEFADPSLKEIVEKTIEDGGAHTTKTILVLNVLKDRTVDTVSWTECCELAKEANGGSFLFRIILRMLNLHLYKGDYSEELYQKLEVFNWIQSVCSSINYKSLMVGERVGDLYFMDNENSLYHRQSNYDHYLVSSKNQFYYRLMTDFIFYARNKGVFDVSAKYIPIFEDSLGTLLNRIQSVNDFSEDLFWRQVEYFRNIEPESLPPTTYKKRFLFVINFYRWLCCNDEFTALNEAFTINKDVLFSDRCGVAIEEGYMFVTYNPLNVPNIKDKYLFLFNSATSSRSGIKWMRIDLSRIQSHFYKSLFLDYYMHYSGDVTRLNHGIIKNIVDGFSFMEQLKSTEFHPNPDESNFTADEAALYLANAKSRCPSIQAANREVSCFRRVLDYAIKNGSVTVDDGFFKELKNLNTFYNPQPSPIPDHEVNLIVKKFKELAEEGGIREQHMLALLRLCLTTELRTGTLCQLRKDDLKPSIKPGKYRIYCPDKTSHGLYVPHEITEDVFGCIRQSIDLTDAMIESAGGVLSDSIFLVPSNAGSFQAISADAFSSYLKNVCKDLGLPSYTSGNLRDTHMTKAVEWMIDHGKTEFDVSLVSGHAAFATTLNSYTGPMLDQMLEATYQIEIGTPDWPELASQVVDDAGESFINNEHEVEDGCGYCRLDECIKTTKGVINSLPCLSCKSFVTITTQLPNLQNRVKEIDYLIDHSKFDHDIDDLLATKRLLVKHIGAILSHNMESANNERSDEHA